MPTPIETLQRRVEIINNTVEYEQQIWLKAKADVQKHEDSVIALRNERALLEKAIEVLQENSK